MPKFTSDSRSRWAAPSMAWRDRARCLEEDPELFFPVGEKEPALLQTEEAKLVCGQCEVRGDCLLWALRVGEDHGVWGGLSADERRALRRRNEERHHVAA